VGARRKDASAISVEVSNRQRRVAVNAPWLARTARAALAAQAVAAAEVCVVVVDDHRIAALHGEWFADPTPTDVITFDLAAGDPAADAAAVRGDVVVSVETAARMARALRHAGQTGWTTRHELAYYVVHGILHLTGYDDRTVGDRRAMRARERTVMRAIGLPPPPRSGKAIRRP
jgi:probable rRNA maturation factor